MSAVQLLQDKRFRMEVEGTIYDKSALS